MCLRSAKYWELHQSSFKKKATHGKSNLIQKSHLSSHEVVVVDHDHVHVGHGLSEVHSGVDASERGFSEDLSGPDVLLEEGLWWRVGYAWDTKEILRKSVLTGQKVCEF